MWPRTPSKQPAISIFHKPTASFSRPLTETIMPTMTTSFPNTYTHMHANRARPTLKRVCNFHSCGQISLFSLSCRRSIEHCEKRCCDIHFCTRVWWLAQYTISHLSHRSPAGFLLLASNHQELIRKILLSTCQDWNFKHNNTDKKVKAVVDICQNKS